MKRDTHFVLGFINIFSCSLYAHTNSGNFIVLLFPKNKQKKGGGHNCVVNSFFYCSYNKFNDIIDY